MHDADATHLQAEGTDHTGSGESIEVEEEGHATVTTVETGEQCNPEKQVRRARKETTNTTINKVSLASELCDSGTV